MAEVRRLTLETVDSGNSQEVDEFLDEVMSEGMRRVKAETAELQAKGVMDGHGNLLTHELPFPDMAERLADLDAGRTHGPYETADEAIRAVERRIAARDGKTKE